MITHDKMREVYINYLTLFAQNTENLHIIQVRYIKNCIFRLTHFHYRIFIFHAWLSRKKVVWKIYNWILFPGTLLEWLGSCGVGRAKNVYQYVIVNVA
jgi:hypothetical protein